MPTKAKPINKSAKTGKIVSKDFADKNPDTTFATKGKPKVIKAPATPPAPEFGKKYIFTSNSGEFIASINQGDPFNSMTIYEVQNGVQTDRTIDVPDVSVYKFVDDADEIFRRLSGN